MWDCIPDCLYTVASSLTDILPTDVKPLGKDYDWLIIICKYKYGTLLVSGGSVLIQILFSALYTKLMESTIPDPVQPAVAVESTAQKPNRKIHNIPKPKIKVIPQMSGKASICNILAEAICSIDEDNKHTDAIQLFINQTRESQRATELTGESDNEEAAGLSFVSTVKLDDEVIDNNVMGNPSPSTRTAEEYDVENADYIAELLVSDVLTSSVGKQCMKVK